MEIVQKGSGIYFLITSVTNYFAQHAESVAPVDPFSPFIFFIWRKGFIVSYTTRCASEPLGIAKWETFIAIPT